MTIPFLTTYDPPGTSEGTLDPLGLYQVADQLAVKLVPAVRERMQRIRFLTAMAVGALVTEGLEEDPTQRDASPYLVWEWLVVEAVVRAADGETPWGVAGTQVAKRAVNQHGYLDARAYLKTPRIFGFNGVYKRLAMHLGIVDGYLAPGPAAEELVDAWARGLDLGGIEGARPLLSRWATGVRRSLNERPPRTKPGWGNDGWAELARAFDPSGAKRAEKRILRELLHVTDERRLGALPHLWALQAEFDDESFQEEALHQRLAKREPSYSPLLEAIKAYEAFARSLQDAFDVLKAEATRADAQGWALSEIAGEHDFERCRKELPSRFEAAHRALGEVVLASLSLQTQFEERFGAFAEPQEAATCGMALCMHHERVQRGKSAAGKRPWFDRSGDRIFVRQAYREARRETQPGKYVHEYRGRPIRRFYGDLT